MTSNFNALRQNNQLYCWIITNKYIIKCKMLKNTAKLDVKRAQTMLDSLANFNYCVANVKVNSDLFLIM